MNECGVSELGGVVQEVASKAREFPQDGEGHLGPEIIACVLMKALELSSLDPLVLPAGCLCLAHSKPIAHT